MIPCIQYTRSGTKRMFFCEDNSPEIREMVNMAAIKLLRRGLKPVFQDGQWHVMDPDTGEVWSVYDGAGDGTYIGLGFERQPGKREGTRI